MQNFQITSDPNQRSHIRFYRHNTVDLIAEDILRYFHNYKLSPIFDECKQLIKETKESAAKIEAIANDPENFIYEYFYSLQKKDQYSEPNRIVLLLINIYKLLHLI